MSSGLPPTPPPPPGPPYGPPGFPVPPPGHGFGAPPRRRTGLWITLSLLLVLLVAGGGVAGFLVLRDDDSSGGASGEGGADESGGTPGKGGLAKRWINACAVLEPAALEPLTGPVDGKNGQTVYEMYRETPPEEFEHSVSTCRVRSGSDSGDATGWQHIDLTIDLATSEDGVASLSELVEGGQPLAGSDGAVHKVDPQLVQAGWTHELASVRVELLRQSATSADLSPDRLAALVSELDARIAAGPTELVVPPAPASRPKAANDACALFTEEDLAEWVGTGSGEVTRTFTLTDVRPIDYVQTSCQRGVDENLASAEVRVTSFDTAADALEFAQGTAETGGATSETDGLGDHAWYFTYSGVEHLLVTVGPVLLEVEASQVDQPLERLTGIAELALDRL
ncbi:hypothetical protein FHP29_18800 [Nocardioides albidus]|uniref:Uncharacterized protein n=1 Tax=Nocardioides albidus TaxID=1517589 RepID=A0A5C4VJZ6_9ACTN|nr:hypothetical protein [Nocardioides albidus]TNM36224.1 hypothetical protein FHP29_18800 [Nocardioides albidus]